MTEGLARVGLNGRALRTRGLNFGLIQRALDGREWGRGQAGWRPSPLVDVLMSAGFWCRPQKLTPPRGPLFGPPLIRLSENSSHIRPSLFFSPWVVLMRELVFWPVPLPGRRARARDLIRGPLHGQALFRRIEERARHSRGPRGGAGARCVSMASPLSHSFSTLR